MKIRATALLSAFALVSAGCATTEIPETLLKYPSLAPTVGATELATVQAQLQSRYADYAKLVEKDRSSTAQYDVPLLLAGFTGVGAVVFGANDETGPISAVISALILSMRSYNQPGHHVPTYVAAAQATSCLERQAVKLSAASVGALEAPARTVRENIGSVAGSAEQAESLLNLTSEILTVDDRLASAAVQVDTKVLSKFTVASAPDVSKLLGMYDAALVKQAGVQSDAEKAEDLVGATVAVQVDGKKMSVPALNATVRVPAEQIISNKKAIAALAELDTHIVVCLALLS